ncbi:sensor histidine kinase [Algoriphagus machipongonensis]|uniref:histidine kinase n=1 Tax=Algoriphagus machipongonensis TaxID=388413 RepID=A3HV34_9BACT|nr:sensor histidine kinase [Algoriphagus machipongonensis]EAZ82006.1 two-component system sensor histidine kinase [Algoriphagus machipongonensis]
MKVSNFSFLVVLFLMVSCSESIEKPESVLKVNLSKPEQTNISQLPDSLLPVKTFLKNSPAPQVIQFPLNDGEFNFYESEGERIMLEPPAVLPLLVMRNEDGGIVRNEDGEPFILGEGGMAQFTTYTSDDGLALDAVNSSLMDSRGHLWFGTSGGGVSHYDGTGFTNYSTAQGLAANNLRSIIEDREGNLWFGTVGGGASKYDGKSFTNYNTTNGLPDDIVFIIKEDKDGNLWFGTNGAGVSKFDGTTFENFTTEDGLAGNVVVSIEEDKNGNLWFGTYGNGVSRYDGNNFTTFNTEDGLSGDRVRVIFKDSRDNLWMGTVGDGVSKYDGNSFTNFSLEDGIASMVIRYIAEDKEGNIWFATGGGISRYDGNDFTSYTTRQGLAGNNVLSITEDRAGKLWFGTDGGGISRYDGKGFTSYTTVQGLAANIVMSVAEDSNQNLWFGTANGGISKFDGKRFTNYTTAQGLASDIVYSIRETKSGNLWIGGGGGLSLFDGRKFTNYTTEHGLSSNDVFSILEDSNGILWFGTDGGGISKFDGESFTNYAPEHGLAGYAILSILEDKSGRIWIGAADGGISVFDGESFTNITIEQGLIDNGVFSIEEDVAGNIWIGTEHGLSYLNSNNIEALLAGDFPDDNSLIFNFSSADGLPNDVILQIVSFPDGKIALGTNLGIALFDGPVDGEPFVELSNLELFNSNTGYPVKDLTDGQNGMFLDSKGVLWAGTGNNKTALARFSYPSLLKNEELPVVEIKQLRINEEVVSWNLLAHSQNNPESDAITALEINEEVSTFGRSLSLKEREAMRERFSAIKFDSISPFHPIPQNLVLPYKNNILNIDFSTNEVSKPYLVEYRYFLDGYDQEWSPILKKSSATFGNIQEGTYTFQVMARYTGPSVGEAGEWTEPISYTFTVLPPWYRSWWAYIIYGLIFLSFIYPISRYQKNQVLKAEQKKARERELAHAREIEKAYSELEASHENLKETQSQLIQAEKMASLGELTAGIAHEIQNPLNFVNNFSEVSNELIDEMMEELKNGDLEETEAIAGDIKENLGRITLHGKRADAIVKAMLQHSRVGSGKKESTDINALADECLRLSFHGIKAKDKTFNADFKSDLDESIPKIEVIQQDLGRVILNMVNNAFYSVNEKAHQLGDENYSPMVKLSTKKVIGGLEITVEDNGTGIPKEIINKIYQPFFTTKPTGKGTGLGLSLSYDIVKSHGGDLRVKSSTTESSGTSFTIYIPEKTEA